MLDIDFNAGISLLKIHMIISLLIGFPALLGIYELETDDNRVGLGDNILGPTIIFMIWFPLFLLFGFSNIFCFISSALSNNNYMLNFFGIVLSTSIISIIIIFLQFFLTFLVAYYFIENLFQYKMSQLLLHDDEKDRLKKKLLKKTLKKYETYIGFLLFFIILSYILSNWMRFG